MNFELDIFFSIPIVGAVRTQVPMLVRIYYNVCTLAVAMSLNHNRFSTVRQTSVFIIFSQIRFPIHIPFNRLASPLSLTIEIVIMSHLISLQDIIGKQGENFRGLAIENGKLKILTENKHLNKVIEI